MGFETSYETLKTAEVIGVRNLPMGFETFYEIASCFFNFGSKPPYGI